MADVLGIGAVVYDVMVIGDGFPNEDTKIIVNEMKTQCGGPEATALVAISKMGISTQHLGTIGADVSGDFVLSELNGFGVDTSKVRRVDGTRSFYALVYVNSENASRTCIVDRGTAPMPTVADLDIEALKNAKFLHVDGNQLDFAIMAAKKAKEFGVKVSYDAGGNYKGVENLLPWVDVLIPSEEFALKFTGCDNAVDAAGIIMERYHPETLIITQGSRGGFLFEDDHEIRYPVFPVNVVDTNGSGDTFHGAFVAAKVKGMSDYDACCFASATAALKCTRFGAQHGIPYYEEVLEFMRTNNKEIRK